MNEISTGDLREWELSLLRAGETVSIIIPWNHSNAPFTVQKDIWYVDAGTQVLWERRTVWEPESEGRTTIDVAYSYNKLGQIVYGSEIVKVVMPFTPSFHQAIKEWGLLGDDPFVARTFQILTQG